MDERERQFYRNLLHSVLRSALTATIWRLPTWMLILLVMGLLAVISYYQLY